MRQCFEHKEVADRLRRSSVGIESEDDLEDHETFIAFKWFDVEKGSGESSCTAGFTCP